MSSLHLARRDDVQELDSANLVGNLLREDLEAGDGLDFDFAAVRHLGWTAERRIGVWWRIIEAEGRRLRSAQKFRVRGPRSGD